MKAAWPYLIFDAEKIKNFYNPLHLDHFTDRDEASLKD